MNHLSKYLTYQSNSKPKLSKHLQTNKPDQNPSKIIWFISVIHQHYCIDQPINNQPTNQTPHGLNAVHRISLDRDIPVSRNQRKNIVTHANNSLFRALYLIVHLKYLRPVNTRWLQNEHQHHVLTFFTGHGRALWTCSCLLHQGPSDLLDVSEPVQPKKPPLNGAASRPR